MAREYGTKLSGASTTVAAALALGALSAGSSGESGMPERFPSEFRSSELWQDGAASTLDDWDDQLIRLVNLICHFFACGTSPETDIPEPELVARIEVFILQVRGSEPPAGATQSSVDTVRAAIEDARRINASQPLLPTGLAAELDAVLAELHAQLQPLAAEPEGTLH
jgi:hypothetical protein